MKEVEPVEVFLCSMELRIGWSFWSFWRVFLNNGILGSFETWSAKAVIPVPPATALHQFCSVPPNNLGWLSEIIGASPIAIWFSVSVIECVLIDREREMRELCEKVS